MQLLISHAPVVRNFKAIKCCFDIRKAGREIIRECDPFIDKGIVEDEVPVILLFRRIVKNKGSAYKARSKIKSLQVSGIPEVQVPFKIIMADTQG